ncbi:MAG: YbhB/YbcL family Raf kinase inhibitor-like protein [Planctomycetes bacterium]|nr:YbhB/YbcL family Raf kinase inhibitor-like protein [Planctomycetota bacterium]
MTIDVTSSAFEHEGSIPSKYTCDGEDVSPPLTWSTGPQRTSSYALIMDDPDAPGQTWVHWVAWNIPGTSLPEAVKPDATDIAQGMNSWPRTGYGGPCPPSGTHRYFFKVYALDTRLDLPAKTTKQALLDAMDGHILAQGELMGTYARSR